MTRARPHIRRLTLVATLAVGACGGGVGTRQDYDPGVDFGAFQTYAWAERTPSGGEDARVYNRVTMQRVRTAVERALNAKGFRKTDDAPDFHVAWHGAIRGQMSATTIGTHYGYGWGWYGGTSMTNTFVNEWDEGTLLIDIVDPTENLLIWRGVAQGTIDEAPTPQEAQAQLDRAAAMILRDFPPGSEGG